MRQLPSGRYQAEFRHDGRRVTRTMDSKAAAQQWLKNQRGEVADGTWDPHPASEVEEKSPMFRDYQAQWLAARDLKPKTVEHYTGILQRWILPHFGAWRLDEITVASVRSWYATLPSQTPTMRAQTYSVLRGIMQTAWQDDLIEANPCRIRGAGSARRSGHTDVPTMAQVQALADEMGVTHDRARKTTRVLTGGKYKMMTLIAAWCGLRFGETTELRRHDVVMEAGVPVVIRVRRAVVRVAGEYVVGEPKSEAGQREVTIPPHIRAEFADYLSRLPAGPQTLLFPGTRNGEHMAPSSLYKPFYRAREAVGLDGLRWHDLRHFSATIAAQTGATVAELQSRLGHSTTQAAMRYQHAAKDRDAVIAEQMSRLAETSTATTAEDDTEDDTEEDTEEH